MTYYTILEKLSEFQVCLLKVLHVKLVPMFS
jgi:hypothetical protein